MVDTTRRRVTQTNLTKNWNGVSAVSVDVFANQGISQHQLVVYAAGVPAVGVVKIEARAMGSTFWVPIGTIDLTRNGTGTMIFCALLDGVRLSFPGGISAGMSIGADLYSTGLFFTVGDDYLQNTERRRVPRTQISTNWNGSGSVTMPCPDHGPLTQHQLAIAGGTGLVELKGRPTGGTQFVTIDVQCEQIDTSGMLVIFAGMYDAFQLVPQGVVTGSVQAQICSVGELLFFNNVAQGSYGDATHIPVITVNGGGQITSITSVPINVPAALGYTPANDSLVVHLAGAETITGIKTFGGSTFNAPINILFNTTAGNNRAIFFQTAGLNRWAVFAGNSAESGGNQGTNFGINRFDDTGTYIDTPFNINRATGNISLANNVGFFGGGGGPTASYASWAASSSSYMYIGLNAEFSSGSWKSQYATVPPMVYGINQNGVFAVYPATSSAPTAGGQAVTFPSVPPFEVITSGEAVQQLTGTNQYGGFRSVQSNIGVFWRFDGTTFYLMKTATGSPFGAWDTTRPLYWTVAGGMGSDQNWTMGGLSTHTVSPATDNAYPLGGSANRWTVVYAASGTINTSDQRDKNVLGPNSLGLSFVNALPVSQFKYLVKYNEVIPVLDDEGNPVRDANGVATTTTNPVAGVRIHVGTMAQAVYTALQNAGIDPSTMGLWSLDTPTDPNSRQGLRENELMWILWTAVQQLSASLTQAQSDIAAIKAKIGMP